MIRVDLKTPGLKPGVYLVLGDNLELCRVAARQLVASVTDDIQLRQEEHPPLTSPLKVDRTRGIGYIANLGSEHYTVIEEALRHFREDDGNGSIVWICPTMNPWVVDRLCPESLADVQQRLFFVRSKDVEMDVDDDVAMASRLDDREADVLWGAYEVGIQYLSEILTTNGFW